MKAKDDIREILDLKQEIAKAREESMVNSVKISELSSMTSLDGEDLMLVSNPLQMNVYRSYSMEYSILSSNMKNVVSCLSYPEISGAWTVTGRMTIPTKRIDENDENSVVNCDWLSSHFLDKLYRLSVEIYDNDHIQSFVGEVIYSTTLKSEDQVKKRYGSYTSWEKVEGRFIMSTTSPSMVGKTTGDFDTPLSINDIPNHEHGISFEDNVKNYRLNWNIPLNPSSIAIANEKANQKHASSGSAWRILKLDRDITEDMMWTNGKDQAVRDNGWADGRVIVAYGRGSRHGEGHAYILPNKGENKPHNNIPPFYTVHVWRRVK